MLLDVPAGRQLTHAAKACSDIKTCRLLQGGSQGLYGARKWRGPPRRPPQVGGLPSGYE